MLVYLTISAGMMLDCTDIYSKFIPFSIWRVDIRMVGGGNGDWLMKCSSQVFAEDIFQTVFEEDPMRKEAGRKYRYGFLEKGDKDDMKILTDFLGREANAEAFYKGNGLA